MNNYVRKCSNELLPRAYTPAAVWHWARKPGHDLGQLLVQTSQHSRSNFFDELIRVAHHHAGWDRLWTELLEHPFCRQYLLERLDDVLAKALRAPARCATPLIARLPKDTQQELLGLAEDGERASAWVRNTLPQALPRPLSRVSLPQVAGARLPSPVEIITCLHEAGLSFEGTWPVKTSVNQKHTHALPWPMVITLLHVLPDFQKDALALSKEELHAFTQLLMQAGWQPPQSRDFLFASDDHVTAEQDAAIDAFYAAMAPAMRQKHLEESLPAAGPKPGIVRM